MWYTQLKFAQIWNTSYSDDSLTEMITALYELTYKFNMMQFHDFDGLPQRFENIQKNLESNARTLIKKIASILGDVFGHWLEYHALLSPRTWADKRLEEYLDDHGDDYADLADFLANIWLGKIQKINTNEIVYAADDGLKQNKMPYLEQALNGYKQLLIDENKAENENDDTFEDTIKNMSFSEIFHNYFKDWETALQVLDSYGNLHGIIIDLAAFYHFDLWYKHWKPQGIDQTRKRIEDAYALIKKLDSMSFGHALAAINIIINTAHQTGGMTAYIVEKTIDNDQELLNTLTYLSNKKDFTEWDNDLRSVGLKI
jgi:hypothetical protein